MGRCIEMKGKGEKEGIFFSLFFFCPVTKKKKEPKNLNKTQPKGVCEEEKKYIKEKKKTEKKRK